MSAYCSQTDIQGEIQPADLVALTDDAPCMGVVNTAVLAQVISNASGYIDMMVGNRYSVPFGTTPPSVKSMAITIACYRLFRRREVPDEKNKFYEDYQNVSTFLNGVKDGELQLDLSIDLAFEPVQFSSRDSLFGGGSDLANSM